MANIKPTDFPPKSSVTGIEEIYTQTGGVNNKFTVEQVKDYIQSEIVTGVTNITINSGDTIINSGTVIQSSTTVVMAGSTVINSGGTLVIANPPIDYPDYPTEVNTGSQYKGKDVYRTTIEIEGLKQIEDRIVPIPIYPLGINKLLLHSSVLYSDTSQEQGFWIPIKLAVTGLSAMNNAFSILVDPLGNLTIGEIKGMNLGTNLRLTLHYTKL